jgi:alpha-D-ribose 1-methylphosphonate 5-triphosphate synthase subunit PhnL
VLSVKSLSKQFRVHILGGKVIEGCREVSFDVERGEFLAVAGPSGSGKSTVLKCVYRTYLPSAGRIEYRAASGAVVDFAAAPDRTVLELRRNEIGFVSQFLRVIPRVSALEVVMQPLLARQGATAEEARARATDLLLRLRLPPALHDAYPQTFSGGEQQRINIARAVIWEPRLMLLDEPTASLDAEAVEAVLGILRELRGRGTTMVGIFHDPKLIARTADRVHAMQAAA